MKKDEFHIGQEFYTAAGKWRCTDIGARVVVAIQLDQEDQRNYTGPPYSIPEHVFDENDMGGCSLDSADFEDTEGKIVKGQRYQDIESAMMFVSTSGYGENSAILDRSTGEIYVYGFPIQSIGISKQLLREKEYPLTNSYPRQYLRKSQRS